MEKNYKTFIHKGKVGYGITFPDFPGCVSDGKTIDKVLENGKEVLQLMIDTLYESGQEIPVPGTIDDKWLQEECNDIECVGIISVEVPTKQIRINVSMADYVIARVDKYAKAHGQTRSGVLTEAALKMAML